MARGDVESDPHVAARLEAAGDHGIDDDLQGMLVVAELGTVAPLVANECRFQPALGQHAPTARYMATLISRAWL